MAFSVVDIELIEERVCRRCLETKPSSGFYTSNKTMCKVCVRAKSRAYYDDNKVQALAAAKQWQLKNVDKRKAITKRYYDRHRDSILQKEALRAASKSIYYRQWRAANLDKAKAYQAQWGQDNPAKVRERNARNRMRRSIVDTREITDAMWECLVNRLGGLCGYCQERPWQEQDHIIPLSRGGRHSIGNVLPACEYCNRSKGSKLLVEWLVWLRRTVE